MGEAVVVVAETVVGAATINYFVPRRIHSASDSFRDGLWMLCANML